MAGRPTRLATGLCGACRYAATVPSARGPRYLRCGRSDTDEAYVRYPQLPVTVCPGFEARRDAGDE